MHFIQLLVLLWKNWILHRRHYLVTLIEIVSPALLSLLLLLMMPDPKLFTLMRSDSIIVYHNRSTYNAFDPVARLSKKLLFYTPDTPVAKRLTDTAFFGTGVSTRAFSSEQDILEGYEKYKSKKYFWGAAILDNFNGSDIPTQLKYELSVNPLSSSIDPLQMTYSKGDIRPRLSDSSPYKSGGFLALQILIDLAYIKIRQKERGLPSPKVKIMVKRIPIPPNLSINMTASSSLITGIPLVVSLGYLMFFIFVVKRLVEEKKNRAKEMMKMMGMSTTMYWGSVFISNFIIAAIIGVVITIVYSVPVGKNEAVLRNSSFTLFFVIILVYSASSLLLCFAITTIFSKPTSAMTIIIILWITTAFMTLKSAGLIAGYSKKMISCLIPNIGISMAIKIALFHGISGEGVQWSNIMKPLIGNQDSFSVGSALLMMLLSCSLYTILLWYLDVVSPCQPGVPKHPLFFLQKSFWCPSGVVEETEYYVNIQGIPNHFEEEPNGLGPSVVLHHLTKVFGMTNKITAVDNVSLNIYPGQITSLLGHNGAGKTTAMNIITGIFRPTKGTVTINGYDIVRETNDARSSIGLCPQHNVLYIDLTVEEHLKLFAGLKGMKWWTMNEAITNLLTRLQLLDKRNQLAKQLSGGMQRKLSLANSIIGESKVLILDEPTTGVDPECRRGIWDLLQELRPGRTILLSTHYMEEADALGDRIAIMVSGSIRCCGSPMFLKRIFGAGYKLRIEKGDACRVNDITSLIQSHVPKATLLSNVNLELIYSLSNEVGKFSNLFQDLEKSYHTLGIESCGVDVTTMDDVFMKVGQITQEQHENKETTAAETESGRFLFKRSSVEPTDGKITLETFHKMEALFIKRARYAMRNLSLLIFQIVLPLLFVVMFVSIDYSISNDGSRGTSKFDFDLSQKFSRTKCGIMYTASDTNESRTMANYYKRVLESESVEVIEAGSKGDPEEYLLGLNIKPDEVNPYVNRYLIGASIEQNKNNDFILTAWFNGIHYHLDPMSVNLLTNALLRFVTNSDDGTICITASALKVIENKTGVVLNTVGSTAQGFFAIILPIGLAFASSSFVLFPTYERVSRAKLLQRMCGISGTVYWLVNLCWDFLVNASSSLFLIIPFLVCSGSGFLSSGATGGIYLLLVMYGLCSISLAYVISFFFNGPSTGFAVLVVINILGGIISMSAMSVFLIFGSGSVQLTNTLCVLRYFPTFAVSWGIKNIYFRGKENSECIGYNEEDLREACKNVTIHYCCTQSVTDGQGYRELPYFTWRDDTAGKECLALFLSFCFWFVLTILLETNLIEKLCVYIMNRKIIKKRMIPQYEMSQAEDSDVSRERQRIVDVITRSAFNEQALVTNKLTKDFCSLRAVNNLTFGVHKEECFGLLGVNGAGKTTVFRMLTGDLVPSSGNAYTKYANVQNNLGEFRKTLGYCPQFDGHINRLTATETLQLFAYLRGIPKNRVKDNVSKMISMCGLEEFADKLTSTYSGGTKRKLSLAMALIGAPPVILLDEPTSGVDPASRRRMWHTLSTMKDMLGVSFVLTSHSMDECEALCNRLAIMVNGEFRCIGSMQNLKSKYGQGYTIIAKISQSTEVEDLKMFVQESIPSAELKGEFYGTLQYYVTDTAMKWSRMFEIMEIAKETFHLEDYIVGGSKLEQIFLAFARDQKNQESDGHK